MENSQKNKDAPLFNIFRIIKKYELKPSIYATATVFHRSILRFFKDYENNNLNFQFKFEDIFSQEYFIAVLALSCKSNDHELGNTILHEILNEKFEDNQKVINDKHKENKQTIENNKNQDGNDQIKDTKCHLNTIRRISLLESSLPSLFSYNLHVPCPFTRILGLLICLNERGILDDTNKKKDMNIFDTLFRESSDNLIKILLDENILNYRTNELAIASIPLDKEYFDRLMMKDKIDFSMVDEIKQRNCVFKSE